ncbi:hypothetical protein BO82DRAFT_376577 [Aspergillus uvarum CBS 121591]|uniref:Uncharacterized protein n=1 Tax=Aspergillus uvarum CBS 121591 TaxID=1448315 RepID=A0A319C549_9EURO|nr:hypothetical protein BO82DRAFT_376577 [Aspergillus uvarum CBS 121591]PYH79251.1 hypothetical protein BO82DRAFT_376577 [Aspergillus uvarum CBS 121591]
MNRYTIEVENWRGANTNYAVMMDTPVFTGDQEPWLNVWYTMFDPFHGSFEVNTGDNFYVWVGTVPTSPALGVVVSSGMSLLARLGSEGVPGIKTGTDFNMPNNNYLVGLAKVNHRGQVSPVGSVAPDNDQSIQVTPKMRFFVTESQQRDGAVVDFSSGEGAGRFYATVTQGEDNGSTVKYYDSFD